MKTKSFLPGFFLFFFGTAISLTNGVIASNSATVNPMQVTVAPLSSVVVNPVNSVPASLISLNHTTVSAEITGRAIDVAVEAGDSVRKGELLAQIDCRNYELARRQARAALKIAKAQLDLAKKQYARNQGLLNKGTISRELFDQADAARKSALADIDLKQVAIETASLSVDRCRIKAPFDGQITRRDVQLGQLLTPGAPLFSLNQVNSLEVSAKLSVAEMAEIKQVNSLFFVASAQRHPVAIRAVIGLLDETTRTVEARLALSPSSQSQPASRTLVSGLFGRLEWAGKRARLPADYVIRRNNQLGVMLVTPGRGSSEPARVNNNAGDSSEASLAKQESEPGRTGPEKTADKRGIVLFHPLPEAIEGQTAVTDLSGTTLLVEQNRFRVTDGQAVSW